MSRPARILVVDDDSLIRRGTVRLMRASGYEALEAASGAEGVELARAHAPDLVLLDVDMPGLGGIEVCRALKADPVLNGTFVVLCSGTRTTSEQQTLGVTVRGRRLYRPPHRQRRVGGPRGGDVAHPCRPGCAPGAHSGA